MARRQILGPVILPLLIGGFLVQSLVPVVRIVTSYRALDAGYGVQTIGLISATFALLPVFLTVIIGRFNDADGAGKTITAGASIGLLACVMFWLGPEALSTLIAANALLGIGQTMVLAGLQVVTSRASSLAHRDTVLGNYMVAISMGQAIGPLAIGLSQDRTVVLIIPVAASVLLLAAAVVLQQRIPHRPGAQDAAALPLREIAAIRGLWWIIGLGSICVAAQDLLLAFLPVLGIERGFSPTVVGVLLSIRAAAAMASRLLFGRAVRRYGRMRLTLMTAGLGGVSLLVLVLPLSVWALALAMAATGFGLGISLTSSVGLIMSVAPPRARGTALSMRMTMVRIAQFAIPLTAGLVVTPLGAGGTFALSGTAILCALAARPRNLTGHGGKPL